MKVIEIAQAGDVLALSIVRKVKHRKGDKMPDLNRMFKVKSIAFP